MLTVTGLPLAMNWRLDGKSNTLQVLQHQMWAVVRRVLFHRYFTDVRSHLFISSRMILNQRLPDQKYINLLLGLPCNNLFDFGKVPNKLFYHLIATIHRRKVLIHIYKDRRLLTEAHRKVDVVNHTWATWNLLGVKILMYIQNHGISHPLAQILDCRGKLLPFVVVKNAKCN